jgi:DNA-binding transcriptional ArsR family regulator
MNEELAASAALIFKAMGHPSRLILLDALKSGERCVCELGELVPGELSTASRHLALLKNAGLITDRRQGQKIYYRLTMGCVSEFVACIADRLSGTEE